MAYDGIVTYGIVKELGSILHLAKIEKIYQPGKDDILIHLHTKAGNVKLFASCGSMSARLCLTDNAYENPPSPPNFCMLLRKHIQGGRITSIRQTDSERIIEIEIEAQTELGFTTSRKLIFEIMGKHSNIILVDTKSGKVLDSCKHISIDVNRYRQILPGISYKYPPKQDKIPFKGIMRSSRIGNSAKSVLSAVSGISPAMAREIASSISPAARLDEIVSSVDMNSFHARIYVDGGELKEFHLTDLKEYEGLDIIYFDTINECVEYFYSHRESSNIVRQKSMPLHRAVKAALDKQLLKKQRLSDDLLNAENSEKYRLYGELLTANIHRLRGGETGITVNNYYNGENINITLDPKLSPAANAQKYYKKYSKSKRAVTEKRIRLGDTDSEIAYLESVLLSIEQAESAELLDEIKEELRDSGYMKRRLKKNPHKANRKNPVPLKYILQNGMTALVGKSNRCNDYLTTKLARKTDLWLHAKDIPGSHVILQLPEGINVEKLDAEIIYEAAAIAAYHSKAARSANVPVDYVTVRRIKKPSGAKPGMVIFTGNKTVYVNPREGNLSS